MSSPRAALAAVPILVLLALATACSRDSDAAASLADAVTPSPEAPSPTRPPATIAPSSSPTPPPPTASATPPPATSTAAATATRSAPTTTPSAPPASSGVIQFDPPAIEQGGAAVVYFNLAASSATLTFGGRQYPMLATGDGRWWTVIGVGAFATPGLAPVSVAYMPPGASAAMSAVRSIELVDRDFELEQITLDPDTAALLDPAIVQNELAQRAAIYAGYTAQRLWSGAFRPPSAAAIGDTYGLARSYNGAPATDYHRGTDFVAQTGDPVYAAAAGRVVFTGELKVRGGSVMIDHGAGVFTAYHHLSRIDVAPGQAVAAGQPIGATGSTGLVTGPHLHWEVIVRGVEVDGRQWLAGEIGPR